MEEAKENHPDTQPIWEADVEAEKEMEVQQLNSKRKQPSKSCCIIFGILALVFTTAKDLQNYIHMGTC